MSAVDVVEGTAEEIDVHGVAEPSTALARRERRSEVIRPLAAAALVESFKEYQELLPQLLNESDYQQASDGKFVKKSGWRKIATAFDLDVEILSEVVERDDSGRILRSKTTARATAPSGRVMDGDGYCTIDEFVGNRARNPKLENDLRGTAATRAKNRAISDLVGMGEVSAEEVAAGSDATVVADLPLWALPITDDAVAKLRRAVAHMLVAPVDGPEVNALLTVLREDGDGEIRGIASRSILRLAVAHRALSEPAPAGPDEPTDEEIAEARAFAEADEAQQTGAGQGALDTGDRAAAGTVPLPANPGSPIPWIEALRKAGCICNDPLHAGGPDSPKGATDMTCPLVSHGIAL